MTQYAQGRAFEYRVDVLTVTLDDVNPAMLLSINEQNRRGHWARAKVKPYWLLLLRAGLRGDYSGYDHVHIDVRFRFPNNRIRDTGNLYPVAKILVDGLVAYGVIPKDDDRHVVGPHLWRDRPNGPHRVVVAVQPWTPDQVAAP